MSNIPTHNLRSRVHSVGRAGAIGSGRIHRQTETEGPIHLPPGLPTISCMISYLGSHRSQEIEPTSSHLSQLSLATVVQRCTGFRDNVSLSILLYNSKSIRPAFSRSRGTVESAKRNLRSRVLRTRSRNSSS